MNSFGIGTTFEIEVSLFLSQFEGIRVISDVRVYSPKLKAETQIDHVILTPWGYFCLEAKDIATRIEGNIGDSMWWFISWRQRRYKMNPVRQNTVHTRALSRAVYQATRQQVFFDNIVVVSDSCELITDAPNVLKFSQFTIFMSRLMGSKRKTDLDVEGLYKVITRLGGKKNES